MRVHPTLRPALATLAFAAILGLTACTAPAEPAEQPADATDAPDPAVTGGDGDYAFGTDRDEIAVSIAAAFASQNAEARWEGDTLVLSIDGDATGAIAGFTECRVLDELLNEGDASVVEFPNGRVDCAEVLAG